MNRLTRYFLCAAGMFLAFSSAGYAERLAPEQRRPNIVVILADDLGWGDVSSYGARDLRTPHIDHLVAAGVKFSAAYANCPVCSPTRAALLSGRYPDRVGVPGVIRTHELANSWGYLAPDAVLLPHMLQSAGYHTALVGKWHLGVERENLPNERGFDLFHGFLGDMMDDYFTHRRAGINYMRRNQETIDPQGHATDLFTQWSVDYIAERARREQPFFLYLAYNAPHTPIQPPDEWLARVRQREPGMGDDRARLVALIEHMDHGIGQVITALQETGAWDNTLVVFTSDNGGQTNVGADNGPWRSGKQHLHEGGIRVPQVAAWPGRIHAGFETDQPMLSMDWYPTLCQAAGAKIEHQIDGVDMLQILLGKAQSAPQRSMFWTRREGGRYMGQAIWAMRQGDWKLVQDFPTQPFELYNLADDPQEQNNLAGKQREQFDALAAQLRAHIQQGGRVPWQKPHER